MNSSMTRHAQGSSRSSCEGERRAGDPGMGLAHTAITGRLGQNSSRSMRTFDTCQDPHQNRSNFNTIGSYYEDPDA